MVRLKVPNGNPAGAVKQFQFLYGAIKSIRCETYRNDDSWFQFLYGAIKSQFGTPNPANGSVFQFLYGAIKRCQHMDIAR